MWYALSKYWGWACGKTFGPAQNQADDDVRHQQGGILEPDPGVVVNDHPPVGFGDVVDEDEDEVMVDPPPGS